MCLPNLIKLLDIGLQLAFILIKDKGFNFEKFSPFIHNNNIIELYEEVNKAIYELNRNGNHKIIITDLSLKLTRLIHQKPSIIDE